MEDLSGSLYDHPAIYDLVFGSDWRAERDFLVDCFALYATGKVKKLFEPACGTGRLLFRLARDGYQVSGLDLNPLAVEYCNERLVRHGYPASAFVADMTDFTLPKPVDAAFNTINSIRHLPSDKHARAHLEATARAVRTGGLYIVGLHLISRNYSGDDEERWSARRGNLAATSQLQTFGLDRAKRLERCRMEVNVYSPTQQKRIVEELRFRTYTRGQWERLLPGSGWEIAATHDFCYNARQPIEVDDDSEDVVYVLRRTDLPPSTE